MFVIEFKVKIFVKISKKNVKFVEVVVLKEVFEVVQIELVLLFVLIKLLLNVCIILYLVESVWELVEFIEIIGLIQNLVVYIFLEGMLGVVVGGWCFVVLQLLFIENCIDVGYQVIVKWVSDEFVVVVLMVENNQCVVMYLVE